MQPRDVRRQVHRGQDPFGDDLGLDECDEAQLGVALRPDNEKAGNAPTRALDDFLARAARDLQPDR
jgi:hypothetical protein